MMPLASRNGDEASWFYYHDLSEESTPYPLQMGYVRDAKVF